MKVFYIAQNLKKDDRFFMYSSTQETYTLLFLIFKLEACEKNMSRAVQMTAMLLEKELCDLALTVFYYQLFRSK